MSVRKVPEIIQMQPKLPNIDLPSFDGDVLCWQSYHQSVKASVVDNPSFADVQKLEYLMRPSKGSAAEAVKEFEVIQENYQPVLVSEGTIWPSAVDS